MIFLDFEKPIESLHLQLEEHTQLQKDDSVNVTDAITSLQLQLEQKRKEIYKDLTPWQKVQVARHPMRPYTLRYIEYIFESFVELFGDRNIGDDKAIVGGLAKLNGKSYMVIGHQKGVNTKFRQYRNFGMANPEGYRKAMRLMKIAEKFNIPIITFIDTPGAFPGIEAEQRGQAEAIARNLFEMTTLEVPILSYVIGEGASGGAVGIGVSDKFFMLEYTWYSVISPESCSSILWHDWEHKEVAAEALKLTADDIKKFGMIDGIIKEPIGGAHVDHRATAETLKSHIVQEMKTLIDLPSEDLINQRIDKYAKIGTFEEMH